MLHSNGWEGGGDVKINKQLSLMLFKSQ
jgi:hypothetical protein